MRTTINKLAIAHNTLPLVKSVDFALIAGMKVTISRFKFGEKNTLLDKLVLKYVKHFAQGFKFDITV